MQIELKLKNLKKNDNLQELKQILNNLSNQNCSETLNTLNTLWEKHEQFTTASNADKASMRNLLEDALNNKKDLNTKIRKKFIEILHAYFYNPVKRNKIDLTPVKRGRLVRLSNRSTVTLIVDNANPEKKTKGKVWLGSFPYEQNLADGSFLSRLGCEKIVILSCQQIEEPYTIHANPIDLGYIDSYTMVNGETEGVFHIPESKLEDYYAKINAETPPSENTFADTNIIRLNLSIFDHSFFDTKTYKPVDIDKILSAFKIVDLFRDKNYDLYVHCWSGVERSPSMTMLYLCYAENMTLLEAADHIKKKRSCVKKLNLSGKATKGYLNPETSYHLLKGFFHILAKEIENNNLQNDFWQNDEAIVKHLKLFLELSPDDIEDNKHKESFGKVVQKLTEINKFSNALNLLSEASQNKFKNNFPQLYENKTPSTYVSFSYNDILVPSGKTTPSEELNRIQQMTKTLKKSTYELTEMLKPRNQKRNKVAVSPFTNGSHMQLPGNT